MLTISGKFDALIAGWLAGLLGAVLEIGGLLLIRTGFVLYSHPIDTVLDASDAVRGSADSLFAFLFGGGFILFGFVALSYAWYAFRCAKSCS